MSFDIYAKNFFLTYPRCDLHPEYALEGFKSLHHGKYLAWGKVVQETHEDGSFHLHAVLGFCKKIRIRDSSYFDLSFGDEHFHGNYASTRSVKDALAYIEKEDGLSATFGEVPSSSRGRGAYGEALDSSTSTEEFYGKLLQLAPRDAVLYRESIMRFGDQHFGGGPPAGFEPVRSLDSFSAVPSVMKDWAELLFEV